MNIALYSNIKKEDGTSIIEIIITMGIVLIIFSLCLMEFQALTISKKQRPEDIAYHIANKKMESLRTTSFDALSGSGSFSDSSLSQLPSGSATYSVSNYTGYSGMKELVVTVAWNDGMARSVVLRTLAGSGGFNP